MPFRKVKDPSTLRIVVFGESSTAGFPYLPFVSFPTQLQQRLRITAPQFRTEVINLGMTAVNSFQFVDMMDEVLEISPDVILVYAGHNEFYGAYGAASTQGFTGFKSPRLRRWMMHVQRTALVQTARRLSGAEKIPDTRTLMARAVRESHIELNSEVFQSAMEGFSSNMSLFCHYFSKRNIPVVLSTVGSNLKDQKPLGSDAQADSMFAVAQKAFSMGDSLQSRPIFEKARQLDPVRFRAPAEINALIRKISAEIPLVHLVDGESALRTAGGSVVEGASIYTDHLHPTALGHRALAAIFYEKLIQIPSLGLDRTVLTETSLPWNESSHFDEAYGAVQIAKLTSDYPFVRNATPESAQRTFKTRALEIEKRSYADSLAVLVQGRPELVIGKLTEAAERALSEGDSSRFPALAVSLSHWQIFNETFFKKTIPLLMNTRAGVYAAAELGVTASHYYADPVFSELNGAIFLQLKEYKLARFWLENALTKNENAASALYNMARLHVLQGDTVKAKAYYVRYSTLQDRK